MSAACTTPGAIAGWLVVTTRREAMRTLQRGVREVLTDDTSAIDDPDPAGPDVHAIERERRAALHAAVERLAGRQRVLLTSMLSTPAPTYEQLSTRLEMPVGSIGPTRDRASRGCATIADLARGATSTARLRARASPTQPAPPRAACRRCGSSRPS